MSEDRDPEAPEEDLPEDGEDDSIELLPDDEDDDDDDEDLLLPAATIALHEPEEEEIAPPEEEDELEARAWVPVEDLDEPDIGLLSAGEPEEVDARWDPVEDLDRPDAPAPRDGPDEDAEDPWAPLPDQPVEPAGEERFELVSSPPALPAVELPPVPRLPPTGPPRLLPWFCRARLLAPLACELPCTADPAREGSTLGLPSWSWVEGAGRPTLRLENEQGVAIDAVSLEATHPVVQARVRLLDREFTLTVRVEQRRDGAALRLGRDALAGRFVVDPAAPASQD